MSISAFCYYTLFTFLAAFNEKIIHLIPPIANIAIMIPAFLIRFPIRYRILLLPFLILNINISFNEIRDAAEILLKRSDMRTINNYIFIVMILLLNLAINIYAIYLTISTVKVSDKEYIYKKIKGSLYVFYNEKGKNLLAFYTPLILMISYALIYIVLNIIYNRLAAYFIIFSALVIIFCSILKKYCNSYINALLRIFINLLILLILGTIVAPMIITFIIAVGDFY
ncbi:hypothetical protein I862_01980 [endosymbiont of Acanthamoeba sp. UWC8]|nr:hypothetical protein I862_01980 [endosymbiont of Acanthamoeba sp. UWC8]